MPTAKASSDALDEGSRVLLRLLLVASLAAVSILILLAFLRTRQRLMQRQEVKDTLDIERERAQITLVSTGSETTIADIQGNVSYPDPTVEQMTNWTPDKARGLSLALLFRIVGESSREGGMLLIEQILSGEIDDDREHSRLVLCHDGSSASAILVGTPIHRGSEITRVVLVLHSVARERQYTARLPWQTTHDALAGLTNRREFEYRLRTALERLERDNGRCALMFLGLDQFKLVSDAYDHAAGDELLCQVCTLLQQNLYEGGTLMRLGGDEFGILLEDCPTERAVEVANHPRKTVQDLHFTWSEQPFSCAVSAGLVYPPPGISILEEALRPADMAYCMAKEKGHNRVQVFRQDNVKLSMHFDEMIWIQRVHLALEEDRFGLYAQPIVLLGENMEEGLYVKLLLRLRDRGRRLAPSLSFVPIAERYGLMTLIDRWVVENAFRTLVGRARDPRAEPIGIYAINLSGATIGNGSFLQFPTELFARYHTPPRTIYFEVIETVAVANLASAIRFISEPKDIDRHSPLDGLCAGMSSLIYLKYLPVGYLKTDGSFIKDMLEDPIDRAMVQVINHIDHVMGERIIAEFVETAEVTEALREIGIGYAQGLATDAPLPFSRQPPGAGLDAQGL